MSSAEKFPPTIEIRRIVRDMHVYYAGGMFRWGRRFHIVETTFAKRVGFANARVGMKRPDGRSRLDETEIAWQW